MKFWSKLCEVDAKSLIDWLSNGPAGINAWKDGGNGIHRIFNPPTNLTAPIVEKIFGTFVDDYVTRWHPVDVTINKVDPGFSHAMHVDRQNAPFWITRVHVPLATNPQAWHRWESDMEKVHFDVGYAYSFNTEERHDFANEGDTPRIHLIFDVHRIL